MAIVKELVQAIVDARERIERIEERVYRLELAATKATPAEPGWAQWDARVEALVKAAQDAAEAWKASDGSNDPRLPHDHVRIGLAIGRLVDALKPFEEG